MSILPRFAKCNTREFRKFRCSRNFVPAKLNTLRVTKFYLAALSNPENSLFSFFILLRWFVWPSSFKRPEGKM